MANKDGQYWIDHVGRKVHKDLIDPLDKKQDQVVERMFRKIERLFERMAKDKEMIMDMLEGYIEWERQKTQVERPASGAFTLNNYEQTRKVQVKMPKKIDFDNRFISAERLINEYLNDLLEGSAVEIRAIIGEAFQRDSDNRLNAAAVIRLKRLKITDARWKKAMKLIDESMRTEYAKQYIVFMRREKGAEWENLKMNFHSM